MTQKQREQINLVVGRLQALSCKAETTEEQDILDDCACLLVDVLTPVEEVETYTVSCGEEEK